MTNTLKIFAWQDLPDYWSDKVFKGIVVNQALPLRVIWNYIYRPVNERNQTQKNGNLPKVNIFEAFPVFFLKKLSEIPQIYFLEEFPLFYPFPRFLGWILVYTGLSFEGFLNIFDAFPHFLGPFPVFRKSLNSQFVDRFPFFGGPFSSFFLGPFPVFRKMFKFSVCWSVSPFFGPFPIFLGSVSGFQKKF